MKHKNFSRGQRSSQIQTTIYSVNTVDPSKLREGHLIWDKEAQQWKYRDTSGAILILQAGTGAPGEANIGANVGTGAGLSYRDKTGVTLNFRSINAITGLTASVNGDNIELDNLNPFSVPPPPEQGVQDPADPAPVAPNPGDYWTIPPGTAPGTPMDPSFTPSDPDPFVVNEGDIIYWDGTKWVAVPGTPNYPGYTLPAGPSLGDLEPTDPEPVNPDPGDYWDVPTTVPPGTSYPLLEPPAGGVVADPGDIIYWDGTEWVVQEAAPAPTGLEKITEAGNTGWRLIGADPAFYGDIGVSAVDVSVQNAASATTGATGQRAFAAGFLSTASGDTAFAAGKRTQSIGETSFTMGQNQVATGQNAVGIGNTIATTINRTISGNNSFSIQYTTIAGDIAATQSAVLGGVDNDIQASATRSVVLGGTTQTASLPDTVYYPKGKLQGQAADPTGLVAADEGLFWYNTTTHKFSFYDGTVISPLSASGLETVTEAGNTGWRLVGQNPANYGDTGLNAQNLMDSNQSSTTRGATGSRAFTSGLNNTASAARSTAMGQECEASANYAFAIGYRNVASGSASVCIGQDSEASSTYSFAGGLNATSSGNGSFAFGNNSISSNTNSIAMGGGAQATTSNSVGIGSGAKATALRAVALGANLTSAGINALAVNYYNQTTGTSSFCSGDSGSTTNYNLTSGTGTFINQDSGAVGVVEAAGDYSAILGGQSNTTDAAALRSVVLGGTAQSATQPDTVLVPLLELLDTPTASLPVAPVTGTLAYDSTLNKLVVWTGAAYEVITSV